MSNDTEFIRKLQVVIDALQTARKEVVREAEDDPPVLEELLKSELIDPGNQILGDLQNRILASLEDLADLETLQLESGTLTDAKKWKIAHIDSRTDELIAGGFEYPAESGKMFELSLEAQSRMNALLVIAASPLVSYPIRWNTIDDESYYDMPNAADAQAFCGTAISTIRSILDSGTILKDSVRSATIIADVLAVADER